MGEKATGRIISNMLQSFYAHVPFLPKSFGKFCREEKTSQENTWQRIEFMKNMLMTEPVKRAVVWISEERRDAPDKSLTALLDEAAMRFNLGPKDWEFLHRFFEKNESLNRDTP